MKFVTSQIINASILWLCLVIGQSNALQSTVVDTWNGGFKGRFDIPLSESISKGWRVTLSFSQQVTNLQISNADIVSNNNNRIYVLDNKSYNSIVTSGSLKMDFIANTNGNAGRRASVELDVLPPPTPERGPDEYQCTCGYRVDYIDSWTGHLKARVTIPLSTPVTSGWTLFLQFSDPVSSMQVFNGDNRGTRDNGFIYKVQNLQHNAYVTDQLVQEFIVTFTGLQPIIYPQLKGFTSCNCTDVMTTSVPATKASTTQASQTTLQGSTHGPTSLTTQATERMAQTVCLVSSCTCGSSITVKGRWSDNVKGEFSIPITTATNSWNLELRFSVPVDNIQIWNAAEVSKSKDQTTYYLVNLNNNGNLSPGQILTMEFIATYSGTEEPVWDVKLSGQPVCGEPLAITTQQSAVTTQGTPLQTAGSGCLESICTCGSNVTVLDRWSGNVRGEFNIPITTETNSWNLELRFSAPVDDIQIWDAVEVSSSADQTTYYLVNAQYNSNLSPGHTLAMEFIATYSGAQEPVWDARLSGQPVCGPGQPAPQTTQPLTTTQSASNTQSTVTTQSSTTTQSVATTQSSTTTQSTTQQATTQIASGCLVNTCTCGSSISVVTSLSGSLIGEFIIPVTTATTSWDVKLKFSVPVDDIQMSHAVVVSNSDDKTTYYLRNRYDNGNLSPGQTLRLRFVALYSGAEEPSVYDAELSGQPLCGDGQSTEQVTQSARTTKQITSSKPSATTTDQPATTTKGQSATTTAGQPATTTPGQSETTTGQQTATIKVQPATTTQGTEPVTVPGMPYPYYEVLEKSILFYEAQRSGTLPSSQRVTWRHNSFENDGNDNGVDLNGGWFDAGDYVKFGLPMAQSATVLAWGAIEFKDAYIAAQQWDWMLDCLKWATDYFLKCHTGPNEFYGQVGDGGADHAFWGRPEDYTGYRPSFKLDTTKPGSDVAGETAAALAAASIVFRDSDATYADVLLDSAAELYAFANNYRGIYHNSITNAGSYYASSGYGDELAWAAVWIYRANAAKGVATNHLIEAKNHYQTFNLQTEPWAFSWDDKKAGVQLLLYMITGESQYQTAIQNAINPWLPGGSVPYTPRGLAYRDQWGVNRYSANMAFLSLIAAEHIPSKATDYHNFAKSQINYMLGDGGRSYVVGFGNNPPTEPHHRSSSCPTSGTCNWNDFNAAEPNPQILYGALVGGPNNNDGFTNDRTDYIYNEITTDYNAGFQSAVAGIYELYLTGDTS